MLCADGKAVSVAAVLADFLGEQNFITDTYKRSPVLGNKSNRQAQW